MVVIALNKDQPASVKPPAWYWTQDIPPRNNAKKIKILLSPDIMSLLFSVKPTFSRMKKQVAEKEAAGKNYLFVRLNRARKNRGQKNTQNSNPPL